ncbi:uncharacterized protein [Neodiprion pinetum]|uniref:uncharacterized protein n=1 Tax=Neodiprion pinetum TaxID=441929 RepID=UPI001EDCA779|nr:uncharacterized protein LOC124218493 [Neodiprion pinetum]
MPETQGSSGDRASELVELHQSRGLMKRRLTHFEKMLVEETGTDVEQDEGLHMEDRYYQIIAKVSNILPNLQRDTSSTTTVSDPQASISVPSSSNVPVRLPQIQLSNFDGNHEDWAPFYDMFTALIHENKDLTLVQKFQYLRSALKGRAFKTIESLETTGRNHEDALTMLNKKYDRKRQVIERHWNALSEFPRVTKESSGAFEELVDAFRQHLRAIENKGQSVNSWSIPIIHLIRSKINVSIMTEWELSIKTDEVQSYTDLLDFLEARANCSEHTWTAPKTTTSNPRAINSRNSKPELLKNDNSRADPSCIEGGTLHELSRKATFSKNLFVSVKLPNLAVLDTASSINLITETLANELNLPKGTCSVPIGAVDGMSTISHYVIQATIQSRITGYKKTLDFFIVPQISSLTPPEHVDCSSIVIPKNIRMADPDFDKPAPLQILLSAGPSMATLSIGTIRLSSTQDPDLYLQKTLLGWVYVGNISSHTIIDQQTSSATCNTLKLQEDMSRFWELEEGPTTKYLSAEEQACDDHFTKHVSRNPSRRYVVALPFNEKKNQLGLSKDLALRRLQTLERRFAKDAHFKQQYTEVIEEYINVGHMTRVQSNDEEGFYLPHHAVIKETSQTTKVRVVFDGSAKSTTGISLNECLMTGPTIQDDLLTLILRFRLHNYVLTGDIEKMYRQCLVRPEDREYLRILWKENDGLIATFEHNTVTFGFTSAPFLAIRTIAQLVEDEGQDFPAASQALKNALYVDDLLRGAPTIEETINLRNEVVALLKRGGFNLRQCASNDIRVLEGLPATKVNLQLLAGDDPNLKTLGVFWNSETDNLIYTVKPINLSSRFTKRTIFSETARIFDLLGLVNPVIVHAKLIMQELWRMKLDWDESIPTWLHTKWTEFAGQLNLLNQLSFHRNLHKNAKDIQVHGFCDASEKAYGACIHLRSDNGNTQVSLFCAKSRVAPIKTVQTIPRLELCAAQLIVDLYENIKSTLLGLISKTIFWSDSSITLNWLNTSPHVLKTFVANRVASIQSRAKSVEWRHVRTKDNPADALSRGQLPTEFTKNSLWMHGPAWLTEDKTQWPSITLNVAQEIPELRNATCLITAGGDSMLERYSTFTELQRVTAYCLRFKNRRTGPLIVEELRTATLRIIAWIQRICFASELHDLQRGRPINSKSCLTPLDPGIDEDGVIRVGGRLNHSSLSYNQKHPIILPKNHKITELIIRKEHISGLHAGTQATLYNLRKNYWIIDGRRQISNVIQHCVTCAKLNPRPINYKMGQLPNVRVSEARPFIHSGVDYCGPFFIKEKRVRNQNKVKAYIAVFTCLATKAVHIELVSDLTTDAFIAALRRFTARRGRCNSIYSDNGTNFVGAKNEIQEIQTLIRSSEHNEKVQKYLSEKEITWHFNPPYSPHFGGIWEAIVESFKRHFLRVVGTETLTFEQLTTLATEIEAILNSHLLTPLSSDINDLLPLTPAHFLIGDTMTSSPQQDFSDIPPNRLSIWQNIRRMRQSFWDRWHKEYLSELNAHYRWTTWCHAIKKGSFILIRDDNLPPMQWRMGRVTTIHPGADGVIRVVSIRTAKGVVDRAVKKLVLLPIDPEAENLS